ncbi:MAG: hypothetical protein NTW21_08490 [Verrucomicrobia bacterium]|nr:hypothetical protein [Verrucomicrobiota bacterium]
MKRDTLSTLLVPALAASMALGAVGWGASFEGLGDLAGSKRDSVVWAVSADGSTVVGSSVSPNGTEAFRWRNGVMTDLGSLPGGDFGSCASGVSADGSVVVGSSRSTRTLEPFRWENGTMTPLGVPAGYTSAGAYAKISRDGGVVSVNAYQNAQLNEWLVPNYYTAVKGFQWSGWSFTSLGSWTTPWGIDDGCQGINANGSVIVGRAVSGVSQHYEACRWDNGVITGLGFLPGGLLFSQANGVSGDGRTIVGRSSSSSTVGLGYDRGEACRWDDGVISALGDLAGGIYESRALAVSDDGEVVVGWGTTDAGQETFVWDRTHGMRSLKRILEDLQIDLTGWSLPEAWAISADGTAIVGTGGHNGNTEGWIARISRNELVRMTLLVSSEHGTVTGAGSYPPNTPVELTATPDLGYLFSKWTGDATGTANPLTITMDSDKTIIAVFTQDSRDPDGDGLTNYEELVTYQTDPNIADTDGDGFSDGYEVHHGTLPNDPASRPDATLQIFTAVEVRLDSALGQSYRIESSTDLQTWTAVEEHIAGTGGTVTRFYSIREIPKRYFKPVRE